jgi:far upstream element-binding protein
MVGLVIGRGGETIKNIQQMSGCNVKIDQNNGAAIRTITVTGQPDNLRYAEEMIQEKVQGSGQIVSGGPADASQAVGMSAAGYDASAAAYYGQQVPQASAAGILRSVH